MKTKIIPYRPELKAYAKKLRHKMTLAEILLWQRLKGRQLCGYDFDRQRPLGLRIVDFYCKELQLAIDADGSIHNHAKEKDDLRQREIEAQGVTLLRFWNYDLKTNMVGVLAQITTWIRDEETRRGWPKREAGKQLPRRQSTRVGRDRSCLKDIAPACSSTATRETNPPPAPPRRGA